MESDPKAGWSRRRLLAGAGATFALGIGAGVAGGRVFDHFVGLSRPFRDLVDEVTPGGGYPTGVRFSDAVQRLIEAGALDPDKFRAVYASRSGVPPWVEQTLSGPSEEPIVLSFQTASYLLNLLWPLGLSARAAFNRRSPINGPQLPSYASTAAWTLGAADNGAVYFNSVDVFDWTPAQEQLVLEIAERTFRPCCDNSTFFQDCNHGSALLGLMQLAATQGASEEEIYAMALAANSYWFPQNYIKTAIYLQLYEQHAWRDVPPRDILGPRYSTASGWQGNVNVALQLADFIPRSALVRMRRDSCGV
jgi:hypothetical protein